jgi:hypothetical protein
MVRHYAMAPSPCGPRLHKADPWPLPDYQFTFTDRATADKRARALQGYIDNPPKAKRARKRIID